jgi:hypothetical protein
VGPGTARVDGIVGSGTTWGAHRHELGKDDGVAGLGTAPAWSMASPARVGEDDGT